MKTIEVVSTKGGSGKTTVALNLAVAAFRRGRSTLLADIDPRRSSSWSLKARAEPGPECVASTGGKLFQIQQAAIKGNLDLMIVDTPGHVEGEIAEAVRIAELCLVVARPTFLDLAAAVQTVELVRRFDKTGLVVVNQAPPRRLGADVAVVGKALAALRFAGLEAAPVALCARAPTRCPWPRAAAPRNGTAETPPPPRSPTCGPPSTSACAARRAPAACVRCSCRPPRAGPYNRPISPPSSRRLR